MTEPTLRDKLLASPAKPAGDFVLASGVTVYLRRWSLRDRLAAIAILEDRARPATERTADIIRLTLCDESNKPLFADGDAAVLDLELGADADTIVTAALAANGLGGGKGDAEKKGTNSDATPNSASSADSP